MFNVLRKRNYALLWSAQLISMMGDWAMFAALPYFVYQLTDSVLATGVMFMIQVLPPLVLGSAAGVFVDRWDRRWTMIGSTLFRGVVLLVLLGVRSAEMIWFVYLAGFLEAAATQFFSPANNALLPLLVEEDELINANTLDSLGENSARIAGPALGGALLAALGLRAVVLFDIGTYLVAAILMYLMRIPDKAFQEEWVEHESARGAIGSFWQDFSSGFRVVLRRRALSYMLIVLAIAMLGDSILTVLWVAFFQDVVGVGSAEYGIVLTVRGVAGIVGGLIMSAIGSRFKPKDLITVGLLITGIAIVGMVLVPVYEITLAITLLISAPLMAWLISSQTWLQSHSPDEFRGRVFGAYNTLSGLLMVIGIGFASGLGETLGISNTLGVGGVIYIFSGVLAYTLLRSIGSPEESTSAA